MLAVAADVGDQAAVEAAVAAGVDRFGRIDAAVAHVAAVSPLGNFDETDDDDVAAPPSRSTCSAPCTWCGRWRR